MIYQYVILCILNSIAYADKLKPKFEIKTPFPIQTTEIFFINFNVLRNQSSNEHYLAMTVEQDLNNILSLNISLLRPQSYAPNKYFDFVSGNIDGNRISIGIRFHEILHGKFVKFFYANSKINTVEEALRIVYDKHNKYLIVKITVTLFRHWKLDLVLKSGSSANNIFTENTNASIICRASGGFPYRNVKMSGLENLDVISEEFNKTTNTLTAVINPRMSDNKALLGCQLADEKVSTRILVVPEKIKIRIIPENTTSISRNEYFFCVDESGAHVEWKFVDGPMNVSKYFKYKESNVLEVLNNTPLNTKWSFVCVRTNNYTSRSNGVIYGKVIEFTVNVHQTTTNSTQTFTVISTEKPFPKSVMTLLENMKTMINTSIALSITAVISLVFIGLGLAYLILRKVPGTSNSIKYDSVCKSLHFSENHQNNTSRHHLERNNSNKSQDSISKFETTNYMSARSQDVTRIEIPDIITLETPAQNEFNNRTYEGRPYYWLQDNVEIGEIMNASLNKF